MLSLRTYRNRFFHRPSHRMALSPVVDDADEIISSLETAKAEDTIELENTPDVASLDTFWSGVEDDLKKDPSWYDFAED